MKLDRYDGEVPIFSEDYEGRERTIFGSATESNNINDQFTPEFMRGWGIVGDTEFPTLQDFNALGFTHSKLISYLYQAGIPSYTANEKYYAGSIVQYNNDIYLCTATEPTSLPTDVRDWVKWQSSLGDLAQIRADKNGFLLNKAGTYNALIDTDLVQTTGQSQTKVMTQKAVTDALAQKQNNLTFVGTGPEVMMKGAFGLGAQTPSYATEPLEYLGVAGYRSGASNISWIIPDMRFGAILESNRGGTSFQLGISHRGVIFTRTNDSGNNLKDLWIPQYSEQNTRPDKNRVLHAGTGTPINTLNVSDMNQDVIDNDNLTVTSGAVYRALLPKANITYVDTELAKKWNIQQTTGDGNVARMSEVDKKLDTSMAFGIGQSWKDVKSQRSLGTIYTNNTGKAIYIVITANDKTVDAEVDGVKILGGNGSNYMSISIPPASRYSISMRNGGSVHTWAEMG